MLSSIDTLPDERPKGNCELGQNWFSRFPSPQIPQIRTLGSQEYSSIDLAPTICEGCMNLMLLPCFIYREWCPPGPFAYTRYLGSHTQRTALCPYMFVAGSNLFRTFNRDESIKPPEGAGQR